MKFTDKLEALKFILSLPDGSEIDIESIAPVEEPKAVPSASPLEPDQTVVTEGYVTLGSMQYPATIVTAGDEDGNIIWVEAFEMVPNSCGTGSIQFNGVELILNMCQMEDKTTVYLPTMLEGKSDYKTPFEVKLAKPGYEQKITIAK